MFFPRSTTKLYLPNHAGPILFYIVRICSILCVNIIGWWHFVKHGKNNLKSLFCPSYGYRCHLFPCYPEILIFTFIFTMFYIYTQDIYTHHTYTSSQAFSQVTLNNVTYFNSSKIYLRLCYILNHPKVRYLGCFRVWVL